MYFDNLAVTLTPGALLEEKHYYPYGLPIKGWGSTASGSLPNRQRYQGNEYREEAGLNWMDFHNRQYDPQLGRFLALDALADKAGQQVLTPYHAMGCNPAMMVDPLGMAYKSYDNGASALLAVDFVAPIWPVNTNARYALLDQIMNADQDAFHAKIKKEREEEAEGLEAKKEEAVQNEFRAGLAAAGNVRAESNGTQNEALQAGAGAIGMPIGISVFSEYLKSITITSGIEISFDFATVAAAAVRSISLTVTAVAIPLQAGAGSTLTNRDALLYKTGLKEAAETGRVPIYLHGNSNNNQNPHGVYVIYKGGGIASQWEIQKYGITGNADFPENRPQYQVNKYNREGTGTYSWNWVAYNVPGRQMAKMIELYHVSQYFMNQGNWENLPPRQFRPDPRKNPTYLDKR